LGPIGGGFGFASASGGGVAVAGAGAGAASSEALTTSLEPLFFEEKMSLEGDEFVVAAATLRDNTNPDAAEAMFLCVLCNLGCLSGFGDLKFCKRTRATEAVRGFE